MALLVCYSTADTPDWKNKAIYLGQSFYKLIFARCKAKKGYVVLAEMASLDYGDELRVSVDQLRLLQDELRRLAETRWVSHSQIVDLQKVIQQALDNSTGLDVAGDMYPVLKKP